jgi:hypothetical protein
VFDAGSATCAQSFGPDGADPPHKSNLVEHWTVASVRSTGVGNPHLHLHHLAKHLLVSFLGKAYHVDIGKLAAFRSGTAMILTISSFSDPTGVPFFSNAFSIFF